MNAPYLFSGLVPTCRFSGLAQPSWWHLVANALVANGLSYADMASDFAALNQPMSAAGASRPSPSISW